MSEDGGKPNANYVQMVEKLKKVDHLFDLKNRRSCSECKTQSISISCRTCKRHLPNGNWADVGLAAEDKDESLFGRFRQFLSSGVVKDQNSFEYTFRQVRYILKAWIILGTEVIHWRDPHMSQGFPAVITSRWKWGIADELHAEGRPDSLMGVIRNLAHTAVFETIQDLLTWGKFVTSIGTKWYVSESILNGVPPRRLSAALVEEYKTKCRSAERVPFSKALTKELLKCTDLRKDMSDLPDKPPLFCPLAKDGIENVQREGSELPYFVAAFLWRERHPKVAVGPPPKKQIKKVAEAVKTQNQQFAEEAAKKEQAKAARQAKKAEAAARKARAQEEQRLARERKAEQRRHKKAQRADKQAKRPGPSPVTNRLEEEDGEVAELSTSKPSEPAGPSTIPPSLEGVANRMAPVPRVKLPTVKYPTAKLPTVRIPPVTRFTEEESETESSPVNNPTHNGESEYSTEEESAIGSPLVDNTTVNGNTLSNPSPEQESAIASPPDDDATLNGYSKSNSSTLGCDTANNTEVCSCEHCKIDDIAITNLPSQESDDSPHSMSEALSPKPKSSRSTGLVDRLEQTVASSPIKEVPISAKRWPNSVLRTQP